MTVYGKCYQQTSQQLIHQHFHFEKCPEAFVYLLSSYLCPLITSIHLSMALVFTLRFSAVASLSMLPCRCFPVERIELHVFLPHSLQSSMAMVADSLSHSIYSSASVSIIKFCGDKYVIIHRLL